MSSNETHMINLNNYEEWFVLYLDEELTAAQQAMVEAFVLQHPHLQEELDLLLGTKLPAEEMTFAAKNDLLSDSMKVNTVDASLLLYIDNELTPAEKAKVEAKITSDATYRLQHDLLQQTKLDVADLVTYPDKKELYRHTEKAALFPIWMRIAVAIVLVLFASLFFVLNSNRQPGNNGLAIKEKPVQPKQAITPVVPLQENVVDQTQTAALHTTKNKPATSMPAASAASSQPEQKNSPDPVVAQESLHTASVQKIEPLATDFSKLHETAAVAVNKILANTGVTSVSPVAYHSIETPEEAAGSEGDDRGAKRTSAKGFLRKVSRFIEKRTGIGTVNADNELLVGAVALKLN